MISDKSNTKTYDRMQSSSRPADLPDFSRPPVSEVALSIQFASIARFQNSYVGLLWERLRNEYPNVSEQPPLAAAFETFGGAPAAAFPPFLIETLLSPPMRRFWFEGADSRELLQVQQDRIVHNWRKRESEEEYPRYEAIRSRFSSDVATFRDFLVSENLGEVRPNQCEVSYINNIELPGEVNFHQQLHRSTPMWTGSFSGSYAPEVENTTLQSRFVLREEGKPYGRTYVTFAPWFLAADNRPIIRLEITVRAKPRDESIEAAFRLLDEGREVVVRTFAAVTTPAMWKYWGRTDAK
jgi:uncharacterized protein (TIGR04255 family)